MSTANEDGKQPENMELPKQGTSVCCGPACGCESAAKPSKARWVVGVLVLAAAGVMVVRGMVKSDKGSTQASPAGFANPAAAQTAAGGPATNSGAAAAAGETSVGTTLGAFSELNTAAAKTDAVFIYLPAKEGTAANPPSATMKGAARRIESTGLKCGLFTLKAGSRDYDQVAAQVTVPAVLAMVKGRGMSAISGDITEAKLVQGFVAASRSGGCGPSAGAGCCPK